MATVDRYGYLDAPPYKGGLERFVVIYYDDNDGFDYLVVDLTTCTVDDAYSTVQEARSDAERLNKAYRNEQIARSFPS